MTRIEIKSKVGPDGVLKVALPVGMAEANREVKITVESLESSAERPAMGPEEWRQFVEETAGSIPDPTFQRHEQGEFEQRREVFP